MYKIASKDDSPTPARTDSTKRGSTLTPPYMDKQGNRIIEYDATIQLQVIYQHSTPSDMRFDCKAEVCRLKEAIRVQD